MTNLILFNYKPIVKSKFAIMLAGIMFISVLVLTILFKNNQDVVFKSLNQNKTTTENLKFSATYISLIFYYILITFTGSILVTSIATEKIQKTLDLMTYIIEPSKIIMSKIYAVITLVLSLVIMVVVEFLIINYVLEILPMNSIGNVIDINFFIKLGIILFCGFLAQIYIYVFCGIGVKYTNQLQTAQFPAIVISFIVFGVGIYGLFYPDNTLINFMKYIPLFSGFIGLENVIIQDITFNYLIFFIISNSIVILIFNLLVNRYIKMRY